MEIEKVADDLMEVRERVARIENAIDALSRQQNAIDILATSVQDLALSLKEVTCQTTVITDRIDCIENDKRSKRFFIWSIIVSGILGAIITKVLTDIIPVIK